MVTLTFDELDINATTAALNDRGLLLAGQLTRLRNIRDILKEGRDTPDNAAALADNTFALDATEQALEHLRRVRAKIDAALPDPEYPRDMTFDALDDWAEGEKVVAFGR